MRTGVLSENSDERQCLGEWEKGSPELAHLGRANRRPKCLLTEDKGTCSGKSGRAASAVTRQGSEFNHQGLVFGSDNWMLSEVIPFRRVRDAGYS